MIRKISKLLSFVLRHKPEAIGIELDPNGWANKEELILAIKEHNGFAVTSDDIDKIVKDNDKKRFILSEDGKRIRANQGHSLKVDVELKEVKPPNFLFHGTVPRFLDSIKEGGLKKMKRNHVHLSADKDTAINVGQRRGSPVILRIDSGDMHLDGHKFFLSENGVWLTDNIPSEYIQF